MRWIAGLLVLCGLAACEDKPPARTVFDPQVKALEKARTVEQVMQSGAERRANEAETALKD